MHKYVLSLFDPCINICCYVWEGALLRGSLKSPLMFKARNFQGLGSYHLSRLNLWKLTADPSRGKSISGIASSSPRVRALGVSYTSTTTVCSRSVTPFESEVPRPTFRSVEVTAESPSTVRVLHWKSGSKVRWATCPGLFKLVRPISVLRFWISEGLTQAAS